MSLMSLIKNKLIVALQGLSSAGNLTPSLSTWPKQGDEVMTMSEMMMIDDDCCLMDMMKAGIE